MPAKITIRAELASLLAKSQEITDANRLAHLRREDDLKADRRRLQAREAQKSGATKKELPDPIGRNIFTAAIGTAPRLSIAWISSDLVVGELNPSNSQAFTTTFKFKVASGNGLVVAEHEMLWTNPTANELIGDNLIIYNVTGGRTTFPAPNGLLVVAYFYEFFIVASPSPLPGPSDFTGPEFTRLLETRAWLVTQNSVSEVETTGLNLGNRLITGTEAEKTDSFGNQQYPDYGDTNTEGSVDVTPDTFGGVPIGGALGTASPYAYLANDAHADGPYTSRAALEARIEELRASDLNGFIFPDNVPVTLPSSVALPTDIPYLQWDSEIGYNFSQSAYVASKYAVLTAPAPPPP